MMQRVCVTASKPAGCCEPPRTKPRQVRCRAESFSGRREDTTVHKLILEQGAILDLPGVYDALTAMICAKSGFKASFVSGYAVSAALLGEPDVGLLTPPEMARKTGQITGAVPNVAVIADADTGGGGVLNVQRTIKSLIRAGAKGCFLEDQQWPKKCGHMRGKQCIDMEEFAIKVCAAREAIGDSDFFLVARTDARALSAKHGLDDAIARANLYYDAGADATFVEAPRSKYEMQEICERTRGLRVVNMLEGGLTPLMTKADLHDMGYHLVVHPLTALYAATKALKWTYGTLREKSTLKDRLDTLATFEEFGEIIGVEKCYEQEERFSKGGSEGKKLVAKVRAPHRKIDSDS
ncbi:unnamed protein product [Pedinophyceae sp. YPF-701]|nr:unnamed protein product [Pedinophyceae sp. YPF-701]